jgi:hypothetical protein
MPEVWLKRGDNRKVTIIARRKPTCFHKLWGIDPNAPETAEYNRRLDEFSKRCRERDRRMRNISSGCGLFRRIG